MAYRVHLDFETRSRVDIRKAGLSRYVRDKTTEPLMLAAQVFKNDKLIASPFYDFTDPNRKPMGGHPLELDELLPLLARPRGVSVWAWNAPFEIGILRHCMGQDIQIGNWFDTMVLGMSISLPGALDRACKVMGMGEETAKMDDGKRLIRKFSVPRKPTKNKPWEWNTRETDPEDWALFCEYCPQDVVAERTIFDRLRRFDLPPHEWDYWRLDQKINAAGWPIDREMATAAIDLADAATAQAMRQMGEITGLDNPASVAQLLPWLQERGYPFDSLAKDKIQGALNRV